MMDKYKDIINLPRHVSEKRPSMPVEDRAAQFAPFAALTGHHAAVKETARTTERKINLDQYTKDEINRKLQILVDRIKERPRIEITYFKPDEKKDGGGYITVIGRVKKIDQYKKIMRMEDQSIIPMEEIFDLVLHC